MAKQQSMSRMIVLLPMMFLMGKIDFENPDILMMGRVAFFVCHLVQLVLAFVIKQKVEAKKDETKIWIPKPANLFQAPEANGDGADVSECTETTYYEHELSKAKEMIQQTMVGVAISSLIHFQFGVNQVVVIQSIMVPLNLYENVLVKTYIFGMKLDRKWEEKLEEDVNGAKPSKKKQIQGAKSNLSSSQMIQDTWDSASSADFDGLYSVVKNDVNATTKDDAWTALMIACGSSVDTTEFIKSILSAGANPNLQDNDGWTALHWCAFHDRPEAARTLLENISVDQRKDLLKLKAVDGRTALVVARDEDNSEVVEIIQSWDRMGTDEKAAESAELRQRKTAPAADNIDEMD